MYKSNLSSTQMDLLVKALLSLKNKEDAYRFLEDILTVQEARSIAQRLEVAKLLFEKETYQQIADDTGASTATVSRVGRAIQYGSGGYKRIFKKMGKLPPDEAEGANKE